MSKNAMLVLLLLLEVGRTFGFLPSWMPAVVSSPPKELQRYSEGQKDTLLDVRIHVGLKKDAPSFVIDGFRFQLLSEEPEGRGHIPLPGVDGPRPFLSSGAFCLEVLQDGSFVNMDGLQRVALRDGCWEMIWRDGAPAGLLICALHLGRDARRNDFVLEKGNVYLTFPVWSKEGLEKKQSYKLKVQQRYREFELERNAQLDKMSSADNLLGKALHYRNAVAATANMDNTGLHNLSYIPSDQEGALLQIGEDLQLVTTGTVWSKNGPFRSMRQHLLGTAKLTTTLPH